MLTTTEILRIKALWVIVKAFILVVVKAVKK